MELTDAPQDIIWSFLDFEYMSSILESAASLVGVERDGQTGLIVPHFDVGAIVPWLVASDQGIDAPCLGL